MYVVPEMVACLEGSSGPTAVKVALAGSYPIAPRRKRKVSKNGPVTTYVNSILPSLAERDTVSGVYSVYIEVVRPT